MATKKETEKKTTVAKKKATVDKKVPKEKGKGDSVVKKAGTKKAKVTKTKSDVVPKLRIRVRAYEHKLLDASVKQIIDTTLRLDATLVGPIPLPTEIKKYTVNRSPFIFKDAREQFEMRVHKRLIDILNPSQKVIEALTNLSLPSGVNIDVKMV